MKFTIYKLTTGEIVRCCETPDNLVEMQCGENESWVKGHFPDDAFYIENKAPVLLPEKPSARHSFNWDKKEWEDLTSVEAQWQAVRQERNKLLAASDWSQLPDVDPNTSAMWVLYRQALRDVTDQSDPFNIVWPVSPGN